MQLKTATLIAIIGQITGVALNLCINFLGLFQLAAQTYGAIGARVIVAIPSLFSVGCMLLFLITLYCKQD